MKILIATLGTHGDVQPYVALGKALIAKGYSVTLNTSCSFEPFITSHGLQYGYLNNDMIDLINTQEAREMLENLGGITGILKIAAMMIKTSKDMPRRQLNDGCACVQQTKPDLIIYHPKAYWGPYMAALLNIPSILALPLPIHQPTKEFPFFLFPQWKLGGWYNKLSHQFILKVSNMFTSRYFASWCKRNGFSKLPPHVDIRHDLNGNLVPVLNAYSRHVLSKPADWHDDSIITGYWFLDENKTWQPPKNLIDFIDSGDPPVYVGFGSMAGKRPEQVTRVVIDAINQANVRGIMAKGWGGLSSEELPDSILMIDNAPHDWLFPKMAAVVHHGGAGTTAAGLRAGKPSIICPFTVDQPFWGQRVYELGVGSMPIPQKLLTTERLANAIIEVTSNETIKQNAIVLGEKIRSENGVENAVNFIENFMTTN